MGNGYRADEDQGYAVMIVTTLYVTTRVEWRRWLRANHKTATDIWLIYYKKDSGKPRIPYNHAVEEALCYGWIDGIGKPIDGQKYAQRFSPRKKTSKLSDMNRERVRRLIKAGRMTKVGLAAIEHTGKGPAKLPADIVDRLKADATVWRNFQGFRLPTNASVSAGLTTAAS